ncbi:hypothetical protein DIPPA_02859 [Diplonema papillatum]|nr:hypothetical protein DIPPA_02859 [Diplonema papillatum]
MRARRAFVEDVGERVTREVADTVLWEAPHHAAAAAAARLDVAAPSPTTPSENGGKVNVSAKEEELVQVPGISTDKKDFEC